jgi:hypothetical protein
MVASARNGRKNGTLGAELLRKEEAMRGLGEPLHNLGR